MSDLISRQAAIDALADMRCKSDEDGYVWIIRSDAWARIDALPSVTPKQRWIPCSERLPENGHYYLWCSDGGNVQSDYYWDGFENGKKFGYNIIAWMPLPEPFREEGDE